MSDWREAASCRGMDTDIWFTERGESVEPARAVCRACPVQAECLEEALVVPDRFGIFGGFTAPERARMRRVDRRRRCPSCQRVYAVGPTNQSYCGDECRTAARRRSWAEYRDRTG